MKKQITQIRDIREIEKQLMNAPSGMLCIHLDNEKLLQFACNFIYLDKNIYTYLDSSDEDYAHIQYGALGSFSISTSEKISIIAKDFTYRLSYTTINGEIKEIDDNKLCEQIAELYRLKYSRSIEPDGYGVSDNLKPVILDTKEIKSLIEEGM